MDNLFRVYTMKMARYLTLKGFTIIKTAQDLKKPELLNWFFEDTEELHKAIDEYTIKYYRH